MPNDNIFVKDLCKKWNGFSLENVSFQVPKGCIVGFIGENGAGKSTTINLLLNEMKRDSGIVEIMGVDNRKNRFRDKIGVVFDECNFQDVFTAKDIGKIFAGVYQTWDQSFFENLLKRFHIKEKQSIGSYSKGMKMKLSLICALAHRPQLLILDEATAGLDPIVRDEIQNLFLEFIQDENCSIFISSHMIPDIQKIADYIILIHQGKIVFEEKKDDLIDQYGILRCGRKQFSSVSPKDYIMNRKTPVSIECLVCDKRKVRRKYKDIVVDDASLEDIMKFYIKEDAQ